MKKMMVITLVAAAVIASAATARTVQDRNWHMCLSFSGSGQENYMDRLLEEAQPSITAGATETIGIRLGGSLTRSVSPAFAVGLRGSYFTEGSAGYSGIGAGHGTELLGIAEARHALSSWLGIKGTAGVGRVSFSKEMVAMYLDPEELFSFDYVVDKKSTSGMELLLEPGLEVRLSSVVTLEVTGTYVMRPTKHFDEIKSAGGEVVSPKLKVLESGFSMGGGIGFHF